VEDLNAFVFSAWNGSLGDTNLDGRFNSADLIQAIGAGQIRFTGR